MIKVCILMLGLAFLASQTQASAATTETVLPVMDRAAAEVGIPAIQAYAFIAADASTAPLTAISTFKTRFAIADDGTSALGIIQIHAAMAIQESLSTNEDIATTGVSQINDDAAWYFAWPVPSRVNGKKVVLDRLYVVLSDADEGDFVDATTLYKVLPDGSSVAVLFNDTDLDTIDTHQVLTEDITMADDCSYLLYLKCDHTNDNDLDIRSIIVHAHTEYERTIAMTFIPMLATVAQFAWRLMQI